MKQTILIVTCFVLLAAYPGHALECYECAAIPASKKNTNTLSTADLFLTMPTCEYSQIRSLIPDPYSRIPLYCFNLTYYLDDYEVLIRYGGTRDNFNSMMANLGFYSNYIPIVEPPDSKCNPIVQTNMVATVCTCATDRCNGDSRLKSSIIAFFLLIPLQASVM